MKKLPRLLPGRSRSVALTNALRLRGAGLSRQESIRRALAPLGLKRRAPTSPAPSDSPDDGPIAPITKPPSTKITVN